MLTMRRFLLWAAVCFSIFWPIAFTVFVGFYALTGRELVPSPPEASHDSVAGRYILLFLLAFGGTIGTVFFGAEALIDGAKKEPEDSI
jgi:hypothetical protein